MKIVVLVKEVPSTEARIELVGGKPDTGAVQAVINPYDEYAIEEALKLARQSPRSTTPSGRNRASRRMTTCSRSGRRRVLITTRHAAIAPRC